MTNQLTANMKRMFVIYGQMNSGKTHTMWLVLNHLLEAGAEIVSKKELQHYSHDEVITHPDALPDFRRMLTINDRKIAIWSAGDFLSSFREDVQWAQDHHADYIICTARGRDVAGSVYRELMDNYRDDVLDDADWCWIEKTTDETWLSKRDVTAKAFAQKIITIVKYDTSSQLGSLNIEDKDSSAMGRVEEGLRDFLTDEEWQIEREPSIDGKRPDFVIYKDKKPYITVEVKANLSNPRQYYYGLRQLGANYEFLHLPCGILTDSDTYIVYNVVQQQEIQHTSIKEALDCAQELVSQWNADAAIKEKKEQILVELTELCKEHKDELLKFDVCIENGVIKLHQEDELKLFDWLVAPIAKETQVCRYVSVYTLFASLDNNSYRLNASEGMNDRSDCNYLQKSLNESSVGVSQGWFKYENKNSVYMMSCAGDPKVEDLTMWRLYGDDARGVCLLFDVEELPKGFYLRAVRYDDELVKKIRTFVTNIGDANCHFEFNYLELWGAYFKSEDYKIEEEIRLVYIEELADWKPQNPKRWVLTNSNQMPNKYVEFQVSPTTLFPLKLKTVIIGPECLEKEVVCSQFKKMMEESVSFKGVRVEISQKESYRTSRK